MEEQQGRELATRVVLLYFQEWEQTVMERSRALHDAAAWAGVDENDEGFRDAIETCWPLGQFEQEAEAVFNVMQTFRNHSEEAPSA
jgi:hypothetical protein